MADHRQRSNALSALHIPAVTRQAPYWARLIPPGELPPRAVLIRFILALGLAIGLWVGVTNAEDPVRTVDYSHISVTVIYPPGYYAVVGPPPVTVRVQGLSSSFSNDTPPPQARIDLRHVNLHSTGPFPVQVTALPPGTMLVGVSPRAIPLSLQKSLTKTIPVVVQPINPPAGYIVSKPAVMPNSVRVTGPRNIIEQITGALVPLDESTFRSPQSLTIEPALINRQGQPVSRQTVLVQPSSVKVTVNVSLQQFRALLPVVPVVTGTVPTGYMINSITVAPQVIPVVSNTPISSSTPLKTEPIVVSSFTSSRSILATLIAPPGLTLSAPTVVVTIGIAPAPGSAATTAQLIVQNKRAGTTVTVDTKTVTVVYQGPIAQLRSAGAPRAVLDVGRHPPGVYHLSPTILLGPGLSTISVTPSTVRVLITAPPRRVAPHVTAATATPSPSSTATATPRATVTPRPKATPHKGSSIRPRESGSLFV